MKLTPAERLILWNQYEILRRLDPEQGEYHEKNQEIVANGYELFYGELHQAIDETPVPPEVGREVLDILNMYRALHFSFEAANLDPAGFYATFQGFDGNESTGHYGFAQFVRRTLGRFDELKDRPDNSHSGTSLSRYRDMLARWKGLPDRFELSPEEITEVVGD